MSVEFLLEMLIIWYREYLLHDDHSISEMILEILSHHHLPSSKHFDQWRIYRARVKYLEQLINSQP